MKKINKIIMFIIILVISVITNVKAAEKKFSLDWITDKVVESSEMSEPYFMFFKSASYNSSFITSSINIDEENETMNSILKIYDNAGKTTKQKDIQNVIITDIKSYNNDIYATALYFENMSENTDPKAIILKYNKDLNETKRIELPSAVGEGEEELPAYALQLIFGLFGINNIYVDDNNFYIYNYDKTLVYDKNLNYLSDQSIKNTDAKKYYDEIEKIYAQIKGDESITNSDIAYIGYTRKNNKEVFTGAKNFGCGSYPIGKIITTSEPTSCENVVKGYIKYVDNNEIKWEKTYNDYIMIMNPQLVGDFIIANGIKIDENSENPFENSEILIINQNGDIIQTINDSTLYLYISGGKNNFMVNVINETTNNCPSPTPIGKGSPEPCIEIWQSVYSLPLSINTKVNGKGNIEVVSTAKNGEEVTFKITPEEGYVLGVVKVTDANGNVLTFTSNTFTMPSSDVTIEATFIPENPETSDIKIIVLSVILIIGSIIGFINFKRVKWLD